MLVCVQGVFGICKPFCYVRTYLLCRILSYVHKSYVFENIKSSPNIPFVYLSTYAYGLFLVCVEGGGVVHAPACLPKYLMSTHVVIFSDITILR